MIANISGRVLDEDDESLVVEVGGAGVQVFVPAPTRNHFQAGSQIFLYTKLVVREDLLALYGFESKDERQIFSMLLSVNGVGPKLALSVLSSLSAEAVRRAVFHEQVEVFNRVPGVGKKTAQKILLHLQDRIPVEAGLERVAMLTDVDNEVLAALTSLGYSVVEAQAALQSIPREASQELEERLRLALRYFSKP